MAKDKAVVMGNGAVLTGEVLLSYEHLFKAQPGKKATDKAKFSAAFVFPKDQDISALIEAGMKKGEAKWPDFREGVRTGKYKFSVNKTVSNGTATVAQKYGDEYVVIINARSESQPGVVGREPDPLDPKKPRRITDPKEVYSGSFVRATLMPFAYDNESKGVSFGLNNVQKLRDGARLDGRKDPTDEFESMEGAPAPMDDVLAGLP